MSHVRTFRAASMQEALDLVRQEMGIEAVVLQTKDVTTRRFLKRRSAVEVTAGLGVNTAPIELHASPAISHSYETNPPQQASALMDRRSFVPRPNEGVDLLGDVADLQSPHKSDHPATLPMTNSVRSPSNHSSSDHSSSDQSLSDQSLLADRLETIESLLVQFGQRVPGTPLESVPPELFRHYTKLIEADVPEEHARDIVLELQQRSEQSEFVDESGDDLSSDQRLAELIESQIPCSGPIAIERGQRKIVALVGPTGVGKTTTIAKLAANFRLRDGIKLGLVTVDTYRVAAVEQLRTYAEIIDLPMKVVTSPLEMRRAIDELSDMDLILIDTAGRSPREELQLQELKALLNEAQVDEVHLVLSLASNPRVLKMTAEKFGTVGVTSLILTKLDEAVGMGTLISTAREINRPMSYFTTGQDVPDDIETADPARASRLVLGQDDLYERAKR